MLVPMVVDLIANNRDWRVFAIAAATIMFFGGALALSNRTDKISLSVRQGFLLTTLSWLLLTLAGAVPFVYSDIDISLVDAWFESVSGMTTTGSTVLTGLDGLPPGILLWRSVLQWIGGVGIIVMAIAMLPFLRVGGMQLFRTESSDRYVKALPKAGEMVKVIVLIYVSLTAACGLGYWIAGMSPFDAVNHAMTTLPTGGYSTHDASFGYFENPTLHWLATLFMISGALPFTLYVMVVTTGRWRPLVSDRQIRIFLVTLAAAVTVLAGGLVLDGVPWFDALTLAAFNVTSIVTTTGYASADYSLWSPFAVVVFFYLTYSGACAGSTTGGIKALRIGVMIETFSVYVKQLIYPNAVSAPIFNGREVGPDVTASVMVFIIAFAGTIAISTLVLGLFGLDFVTSLTAASTAVANVGPGLGQTVGPSGNFASLPDGAKLTLCVAMLLGRLEIFTVLVLFTPVYWRY